MICLRVDWIWKRKWNHLRQEEELWTNGSFFTLQQGRNLWGRPISHRSHSMYLSLVLTPFLVLIIFPPYPFFWNSSLRRYFFASSTCEALLCIKLSMLPSLYTSYCVISWVFSSFIFSLSSFYQNWDLKLGLILKSALKTFQIISFKLI